jgi:hypothetical protein
MSGPHDFAVRAQRHSSFSTWPASIASRLTFRDDSAYAPLAEAGRRERTTYSRLMKSEKFLRTYLDHPNHLELSREIGFCAQGIFAPHNACKQRGLRKNAN